MGHLARQELGLFRTIGPGRAGGPCGEGRGRKPGVSTDWLCFVLHTSNLTLQTSPQLALFRTLAPGGIGGDDLPPRAHCWAPAGNWLCFAQPANPPKLGLFCAIGVPDPGRASPNWLCFSTPLAIQFSHNLIPGRQLPSIRFLPKLALFCTIDPRSDPGRETPGRRAGVPPQICPQSAIGNPEIGFVSHSLPSRAPADRPNWVRFAQSACWSQAGWRRIGFVSHGWLRPIGFVLHNRPPSGPARQGIGFVSHHRPPDTPSPRCPIPPKFGFV
jgi:hypothetical protein